MSMISGLFALFGGTVSKRLTAAEIADLHDNPVELAPAPGVGKSYQVLAVMLSYHAGQVGFTSADGRILVGARAAVMQDYSVWETEPVGTDQGDGCWFLNFVADPPAGFESGDAVLEVQMNGQTSLVPPVLLDNEPLAVGNPNTDFVDGDGELVVSVTYVVIDLD